MTGHPVFKYSIIFGFWATEDEGISLMRVEVAGYKDIPEFIREQS